MAVCETAAYNGLVGFSAPPATGPSYYGWLGISAANWTAYGCVRDGLSYYSVADNIACAERIQATPPDQNGCGSW